MTQSPKNVDLFLVNVFSIGLTIGFWLLAPAIAESQSLPWQSRGVGGGGSLYSPSINPTNNDEFYVGCDMSGLYHSTDFGDSYTLMNFQEIQGGHNSKVQFTNNPEILYSVNYANDQAVPVKSTDGGVSWADLPGNPDPSEETYTLAVDYNLPNRVIIGYYGAVYCSSDGGMSFHLVYTARNSGAGVTIGGTYFEGNTIILGTSDGLLVSANGGTTFTPQPTSGLGPGERIFSFAAAKEGARLRFYCLTADSNDVYVGVPGSDYWGFMKGVYSMDDGSGTWVSRMNGITAGTDFLMFVATAQNDTATVYLGGSSSSGEPNIMKSTNAGATWMHVFLSSGNANIRTGWSGDGGDRGWGYGECVFGLTVAPSNSQRVLFTDFGFVHRTTDGGTSWRQAYLAGTDENAAAHSTPDGKSYHGIGLEVTSCWQVFWVDRDNMFAAFSDIKGVRSTDAGQSWSFNYSGHDANTMYRIVRGNGSGTMYAATSNIHDLYQSTRLQDAQLDAADAGGKVLTSTDGGVHWTTAHLFNHPVFWIAIDPGNPNRMYASVVHSTQGGVYVTDDLQDGATSQWTKLPDPPRTEGHPASLVVLNDGTLVSTYSGRRTSSGFTASSGVFVYNPPLMTWRDASDPGMRYWTKDLVVDPGDTTQDTWYVGVFSGWGGPPNGLGGLYRSRDRGVTWKRISDLDRVTSCSINPANTSEMYLTTETTGLWHSTSLNVESPSFNLVADFPFRQPERVFFNPFRQGELWVSTFGAGMMMSNSSATSVAVGQDPVAMPVHVRLLPNYPNPFNPMTVISGQWTMNGDVRLAVFDMLGREVALLADGRYPAGTYSFTFDGSRLSSGVYYCRLTVGGVAETRSMILVR